MKNLIYIILLLLMPLSVIAQSQKEVAIKEISSVAKATKSITCDFTQTKTSRMLTRPVVTTGHLLIAGDRITLQYGGKTKSIRNIFGSDMQDEKKFRTEVSGTTSEWVIRLIPKDKRFARMYSLITVHFNRKSAVIERIELQEKSGSKSDICLSNIHKNS